MPAAPSFYGQEGEQGEPITGSPEEEVTEMLDYYQSQTDDPGEICLPIDASELPADFASTCTDLGATWLFTTNLLDDDHESNLDRIRAGPLA